MFYSENSSNSSIKPPIYIIIDWFIFWLNLGVSNNFYVWTFNLAAAKAALFLSAYDGQTLICWPSI